MKELEYSIYSSKFYGASLDETLRGVLLRKNDQITCLQPWPQLGDPTLEELLPQLDQPKSTWHPLLKHSMAVLDDKTFNAKTLRSYEDAQVSLPSHALVSYESSKEQIIALARQGFSQFKIKFRPHFEPTQGAFRHFQELKKDFSIKLRLDANSFFKTEESFLKHWDQFRDLHDQIEFIEDPIPFELESWRRLQNEGVRIAADRPLHFMSASQVNAEFPASVLVMKPIRHLLSEWENTFLTAGKKLVFTTALDHPWGQLWAFHAIHILRQRGMAVESSGLFTETLQSSAFNPIKPKNGRVHISGLSKLIAQTEELVWSKFSRQSSYQI